MLTSEQGDKDVDYEYDLYAIATELYPGSPSAGYELLRFGKVIGPDSVVAEEKHNWQWVTYGAGQQGYIDLADASVQVLSDADFPYWLGWQKVEGGLFPESGQCNMLSMLDLLGVARDLGATKTDPSGGALSVAPDVADDKGTEELLCDSSTCARLGTTIGVQVPQRMGQRQQRPLGQTQAKRRLGTGERRSVFKQR